MKYAEVLTDEQGNEYVARERTFAAALDADQIKTINGRARLRPLNETGDNAFAAAYGAVSFAYAIKKASVTKKWSVDLEALKDAVASRIDADAEAARLSYVTSGSAQAMVYQRKSEQAADCLANHDSDNPPESGSYPALDAEVGITGEDVLAVAAIVSAEAEAWHTASDAIETLRLAAKRDVKAAEDAATLQSILAGISWPQPD